MMPRLLLRGIAVLCGGFCIFVLSMDFLRDIIVNLLSNAIWAVGGFMLARFLFLKKSVLNWFQFKKSLSCSLAPQLLLSGKDLSQSRYIKKIYWL
jgi:hypothetical protein